jgi:hypothetical protein
LVSFSCHIAKAEIPNVILNATGENSHICLFLILNLIGKAFSLLLLCMVFALSFLKMLFIRLKKFPFLPSLLNVLSQIDTEFCQMHFWIMKIFAYFI